jgi:hypothetical protein
MKSMDKLVLLKEAIYPISWDNGSYSFFDLTINLKSTATLETLQTEKESASCFVTLIHEYIHFIQNFTTTFGFTNFVTYVDLFSVFFGDNILLDSDPSIPTKNGIVDTKLGHKNFENFVKSAFLGIEKDTSGRFIFQTTTEKDYTIIDSSITNPYWQKNIFISYIAYQGKLIPLNELVASENMAIVASYLSSGLTLDESKQTISNIWEPQYHIIYSFLNNIFPAKNCFKLTYIISEISLLIVPYNKIISVILKHLTDNKTKLEKLNEDEIISNIKVAINFDKALEIVLRETNKQLEARILTFAKHEKQFGFFIYLKDILSLFKSGLAERAKNPFTFRDNFDSLFLNSYAQIIKSPILVFSDSKKTMLGEPTDEFVNSIATVSGVLTVFHQTYFNKLIKCPFASDQSICSLTKGKECYSDPLAIYGNEKYKGCLLHNSLNILGLKKADRT